MNAKKILALLLCLALTLILLVSCDEPSDKEGGSPKDSGSNSTPAPAPTTPDEYIALALAYMQTHAAKCTTTTVRNHLGSDLTSVEISYEKGDTYTIFEDVEGKIPSFTYHDGTLYAFSTQRKITLDFAAIGAFLQRIEFDTSYFSAFGYENLSIGKDESGNTVITGKAAEGRFTELEKIFGSMMGLVDPSSATVTMVFDEEYRLIKHTAYIESDMITYSSLTASVPDIIRYSNTVTNVYEYDVAYEPILPENADDYTTVTSLRDLYYIS